MVNRHRGEIEAVLDGKPHRLCLTLGALAELEDAFGEDDMLALASRFEAGRLSARDAIRIIGAGLRGGGLDLDDATIARMQSDCWLIEHVKNAAQIRAELRGKANATPTTLVLDRLGRIAARVSGPVTTATLSGLVNDVLGESA